MKFALPLSWKLSLVPAAVALLLVASVLALADRLLGRYLEGRAKDQVGQTALRIADAFSNALNRRVGEVQLLARSERLEPGDPPDRMREELVWLQRHTAGYAWLGVTDIDGRVIAGTGGLLEGQSIAKRPVFLRGLDGPWVGDVHPAVALAPLLPPTADGRPPQLIDIAVPLIDESGRRYGVLAAHVDWHWFQQLLVRTTPAADGLGSAVLSGTGELLLGRLTAEQVQALRDALAQRPDPGRLFELDAVAAPRHVAATAPLQPATGPLALGWQIVAEQDLDAALAPVTALQRGLIGGGLLVALGFGVGGWLLSRRMSLPYAGLLAAVTERYAVAAGPQRALGLTGYLDALAEQLRRQPGAPPNPDDVLSRVIGDAQRLRAMLDQLPAALYLSGPDDRLLYWNTACESMFGWTSAEALGRPARELLRRADADPGHERLHQRIASEPGPFEFSAAVRRRDGRLVRGDWRLSKVHDRDGSPLGLLAQVRDVTAEHAARAEAETLEHRLRLLTDAAVDYALVTLDAAGHVTSFNAGAERLTGWRADEVLGRAYALFRDEAGHSDGATDRTLVQAAQDGRVEFEGWCRKRDGSRFWGNVLVYRIGASDAPSGYAQITRDLSARRDAEKRRRESEAMLAAVIQSASDAVISTDAQGRIELVNPAAEKIFGRSADALLGQPLDFLLPPKQRARHGADLAAFAASQSTRRSMGAGRVQGLRADGALIELEASISQVRVNDRQVLTAILRDVTDRVRAEQALLQSQLELTELTQRLMAQEKETTRRLAQALHDRLGQTLAALRLGLDALPADTARERLDRQVGQAIGEVREVLAELRPPLLDEQGLAAALDNEIAARRPLPEGVDLVLDVPAVLAGRRWPPDVEYAAFMVAREAIGNALLHAGAALVRVSIDGNARRLALEVGDDGRGLAPEYAAGRPGHLGVVGMRERALAIGARFEVQAPPGEGTVITLLWEEER